MGAHFREGAFTWPRASECGPLYTRNNNLATRSAVTNAFANF